MEENMSEEHETSIVSTPRHLWVVGVVALLWNAMGAMDYIMTQTRNEAYLSSFTPEQLAFFHGFPTWVVAAWAIAVWGGVLGTILLLLRRRHAVWAFLASLIAMVLTAFHNYVLSNGMEVVGDAFSLGFTAAIFIIALALFLYARAMQKQNILV
jgi:hypothetical protein